MITQSVEEVASSVRKFNDESISNLQKSSQSSKRTLPSRAASKSQSKIRIVWCVIFIIVSALMAYFVYGMAVAVSNNFSKLVAQERGRTQSQLNVREKAKGQKIVNLTNKVEELQTEVEVLQKEVDNFKKELSGQNQQIKNVTNSLEKIASQASTAAETKEAPPDNPAIIINIPYNEQQALPLPVNFLRRDSKNNTIADILYSSDELRKKRVEYHQQRETFINTKSTFSYIYLIKYNLALDEEKQKLGIKMNMEEWQRLNEKFKLIDIKYELPMCVVIPAYNNNANSRIQYNLNSVFAQNYTNYKVILIDDRSDDGSRQLYRKYFAFHRIDKQHYVYVENSRRITALQNIYLASMNHCPSDSVVVTIDADDEFIGRNVLQVFNWAYQTKKAGVAYSNFFWYYQGSMMEQGSSSVYSEQEKKNNLYRNLPLKIGQLRSFRAELIHQIDPKDLQDENGDFFPTAYDSVLFLPLMQLSCGRVTKIQGQFHYLYNMGTGLNDYKDSHRQQMVRGKIRRKRKYECFKDFDERMNKLESN